MDDWQAPPVDVTGCPGHDKLRAYWQRQPRGEAPARRNPGWIGQQTQQMLERNQESSKASREKAHTAHAMYTAGMALDDVAALYEMTPNELKALFWRHGLSVVRVVEVE